MRYIASGIHGCYDQYQMLLEKIQFSEKDELYVLGDVVDRGPEPIKVLQDMMKRSNVIFILGNHDFLEGRADYSKRYYPDENIFLVTGHTPTVFIKGWGKTEVYRKNGHIALDCACVQEGNWQRSVWRRKRLFMWRDYESAL